MTPLELAYKMHKIQSGVEQYRACILITAVIVPFDLLLLAGCGAHWPDCVAVIDLSHSSVSLSSVKSSARSATVKTDASECFMAVAL